MSAETMITHSTSNTPRVAVIIMDSDTACFQARWLQRLFSPYLQVYLFPSIAQALPILTDQTIGVDLVLCDVSAPSGSTAWDALHALAASLAHRMILVIPLLDPATSSDPKGTAGHAASIPPPYLGKFLSEKLFSAQVHTLWQRWQTTRNALATVQVLERVPDA